MSQCVICPPKRPTEVATGHCCPACASHIDHLLTQIPTLAGAATTTRPTTAGGTTSRPHPGSKPPCDITAIDPELALLPTGDTILGALEEFEILIRGMRGLTPYGPASLARALTNDTRHALTGVCQFLATQTDWATHDENFGLEDYHRTLQQAHRLLSHWDTEKDRQPSHGLRCPTITDTGTTCGCFIRWNDGATEVTCPRCHATRTPEWLLLLGADGDAWADAEAIAAVAGIHEATIRRWARSGKVRKRGMLYSLADVHAQRVGT